MKAEQHIANIVFCSALLSMIMTSAVRADSDLYWCNASNYLAYDVRGALHSSGNGHELRIVLFEGKEHPPSVATVSIPEGQVHRLECGVDSITLIQYEDMPIKGVIQHRISVKESPPRETASKSLGDISKLTGSEPRLFWASGWSQGKPIDHVDLLPSKYKLIFQRSGGEKCAEELNVKVLLRSPSTNSPDFKVYEFSNPVQCGE